MQQHESVFRPASFTVSSAVEEDPFLNVDELGDGIAELEALESELMYIDHAEEMEFADWLEWKRSTEVSFERSETLPRWSTVARTNCASAVAAIPTSAMAENCFDRHYEKVLAAGGGYGVIRASIAGARTAYTAAWNAAGPGAQVILVSSVRVAVMFGWIGAGVLAVGTVGYGAYLAHQCYSNRNQASWSPVPIVNGPAVLSTASVQRGTGQGERWLYYDS